MSNRKRVLLISCSIILLCITIIAGMTYSLFTEDITVNNHLKAGNLDIELTRTNLKYKILDGDGYLKETTITSDLELTNTTLGDVNIFGLDSKKIRIVPGSYFEAELQIKNAGEVAFVYNVDLVLSGMPTHLAKQLKITIISPGQSSKDAHSAFLSDFTEQDGYLIARVREMAVTSPVETFTIRIEFVNDIEFNKDHEEGESLMYNNLAQEQTASFDLIVTATQKTNRP